MKQDLLVCISALSGLAGLTGCGQAQKQEAPNLKRPNVIFIYSDDLGIGDLVVTGLRRFLRRTLINWRLREYSLPMPMQLRLRVLRRVTVC